MSVADALVAQLDRASDYGSEGCEFESRRAHHIKHPSRGVFLCATWETDEQEVRSLSTSEADAGGGLLEILNQVQNDKR